MQLRKTAVHNEAHVCMPILQSEATPGEDEMNPTVKRSGWHPPEDTGLWAIADRVTLEVGQRCLATSMHVIASPIYKQQDQPADCITLQLCFCNG